MSRSNRPFFIALMLLGIGLAGSGCEKIPENQEPDKPGEEKPDKPDNPDNPDNPDKPDTPDGDYFQIVTLSDNTHDADTFLLSGYEAGYHTLVVKTNLSDDKWSATSDAAWCTTAKDGNLLKISYEQYGVKNDAFQPRSCSVTVDAGTVFNAVFTVAQQAGRKQLTVYGSPSNPFYISPSGTPSEFLITTNQWDWKIENQSDWLTAEHVDRMTLRVTAAPKQTADGTKRKGTILLYSSIWKSFDSYVEGEAYRMIFYDADTDFSGEDYGYGDNQTWD